MRDTIVWEPINAYDETLPEEAMIQTPIGLFRANSRNPINSFNFFMVHSNFSFSKKQYYVIRMTPGIETLTLLSPFKVLVSIGKLFKVERVKQLLELRILGRIVNDGMTLEDLPDSILKKQEGLATLVFPNSNVLHLTHDDYESDIEAYRKTAELVGGVLLEKSNVG